MTRSSLFFMMWFLYILHLHGGPRTIYIAVWNKECHNLNIIHAVVVLWDSPQYWTWPFLSYCKQLYVQDLTPTNHKINQPYLKSRTSGTAQCRNTKPLAIKCCDNHGTSMWKWFSLWWSCCGFLSMTKIEVPLTKIAAFCETKTVT